MKPVYTKQQLETLKRPQLWEICQQLSLPKYPASAKCIEAILNAQPFKVEHPEVKPQEINSAQINDNLTVVYAGETPIACITYDDSDFTTQPYIVKVAGEEIHRANTWAKCFHYVTWHHKQNTLLDKPFDELTIQEWQELKASHQYQIETTPTESTPDQYQIETTLEETQVDSIPDPDFGILCRLWHGVKLLGTFYRKIFSDDWIATPTDSIHPYHCENEDDARYWLVAHNLQLAT